MKKNLILFLTLISSLTYAQNQVKGVVFEDVNKNGKKDRTEKGIEKVAVSNGVQVVLTDANGKYELPLQGDEQIFVIKPAHYRFALDEFNLPKYYVHHKPQGSPDENFKYKAFEPSGKLPKSLDFGLIPQNENPQFTSLLFGDPQAYDMQQISYFEQGVVQDVIQNKEGVSFGISLGDLVGDDLNLHLPYKKAIQKIGLPWYNVIGNHDMNFEAKEDKYSDESYEMNLGPANFAFNFAEAHFIVLDNILYPHPQTGKGYLGGFRPDQLEFLRNNLKYVPKDKLLVISFHIPLFIPGLEDHFDPESRQEFMDALVEFPNILLLSAHTHRHEQKFYTEKEGWKGKKPLFEYNLGTTSGDWYSGEYDHSGTPSSTMRDGTPRGYAYLKVDKNQYTLDYKVANHPIEYQMEIFVPKVVGDKGWSTARVLANVFNATEKDKVEFRVDKGEWKPMHQVLEIDPVFYNKVQKWDISDDLLKGRRPSNPVPSTHLWSASLPNKLGVGEHVLEVRWTDVSGKTHTTSKTYKIESSF